MFIDNYRKIEEQKVATSEWIATLSLVLISVAVPILLTQAKGIEGTAKNWFFWVLIAGMANAFLCLVTGLLFKWYFLKSLRTDPHYHFHNQPEGKEVPYETYKPIREKNEWANAKLYLTMFLEPVFFVLDTTLILVAAFILAGSN